MKLESLKSEKFEAFIGNEIQKSIEIKGGLMVSTTRSTIVNGSKTGTITDRNDGHCNEYWIDGAWR
jgi:hypothetical protein